jgi:aspartate/methionine/tyrosine aminotransferase
MTNIINKHFKTHTPVLPEHIFTHTGATASIYHMIMTIADPGDYVMIQAPYYGAFDKDICVDSGVNIYPFHNPKTEELSVSLDFLESTYSEAVAAGKKITAIIITNPSNPLGR